MVDGCKRYSHTRIWVQCSAMSFTPLLSRSLPSPPYSCILCTVCGLGNLQIPLHFGFKIHEELLKLNSALVTKCFNDKISNLLWKYNISKKQVSSIVLDSLNSCCCLVDIPPKYRTW